MLDNIFYIAVTLEIVLVFYFIISEVVKGKLMAINLKQENLKLKNEFQENLFQAQEKERNNLVNDVHDSFGGYIEALRLSLLQKTLDKTTINTVSYTHLTLPTTPYV